MFGALLVGLNCLGLSMASYAGQWEQDDRRTERVVGESNYWYAEEDGTYPSNTWKWIDGRCYYFNQSGWMLSATHTPDGYKVDGSGAWVPGILKAYPEKISFTTSPFPFTEDGEEYVMKDRETIDSIVRGLGSLTLGSVQPGEDTLYFGMSSTVTLYYSDGSSQRVSYLPPVFWANGSTYWILSGDAGCINSAVYKDWFQSCADSGVYCELPEGRVSSLKKDEETNSDSFFYLTDSKGITYPIDCLDAIIKDGRGYGRVVLDNGFGVRILYDKADNGIYHSKIILITAGDGM